MADIYRFVPKAVRDEVEAQGIDPDQYQVSLSEWDELVRLEGEDRIVYAKQLKAKYGDRIALSIPGFEG